MRKIIFWALVLIFAASISIYNNVSAKGAKSSEGQILSLISGAKRAERQGDPIKHYKLYGAEEVLLGYVVKTTEIEPKILGYAGEIDALVGIDTDGEIASVKVVSHNESPNYFPRVISSGLLKRFVGLKAGEASRLDAVTSATLSSGALIEDVSAAVSEVAKKLIGTEVGADIEAGGTSDLESLMMVIPLFAGTLAAFAPRKRYLRAISLAAGFLFVGIYLNSPITIGNILDIFSGRHSVVAAAGLSILIVVVIILGLFKHSFYCMYICPFGAIQEGACTISKKRDLPEARVERVATMIRYITTALVVIAVFVLGLDFFKMIEPFSLFFSLSAPWITWVQGGVVILFAFFFGRIWCRYFCPTGFFIETVSDVGCRLRGVFRNDKK